MSEITQQFVPSYIALIVLSILPFLGVAGLLWRKGKTVEALLIWMSMWLYIIALILLFR